MTLEYYEKLTEYLFKIQRDVFYNGVSPKCETLFKRQTFLKEYTI